MKGLRNKLHGSKSEKNYRTEFNSIGGSTVTNQVTEPVIAPSNQLGATNLSTPISNTQAPLTSNIGSSNLTTGAKAANVASNLSAPVVASNGLASNQFGATNLGTSGLATSNGLQRDMGQNFTVTELPVQMERIEKAPIIQEKIVPTERIEIQPIIHREREIPEFREIIQPMKERSVAATEIRNVTLPAEHKPTVTLAGENYESRRAINRFPAETITTEVQREVVTKNPIVKEIVRKKIIEEVQPVIYKEVVRPVVVTHHQTILERFIDRPRFLHHTRAPYEVAFQDAGNGQWMHQPQTQQFVGQQYGGQQFGNQWGGQQFGGQQFGNQWSRQPNGQWSQGVQQPYQQQQWNGQHGFGHGLRSQTGLSNLPQSNIAPQSILPSLGTNSYNHHNTGYYQPTMNNGLSRQLGGYNNQFASPMNQSYGSYNTPRSQLGGVSTPMTSNNGIPVPPPAPPVEYLWRNRAPFRHGRSFRSPQSNYGSNYPLQSGYGQNFSGLGQNWSGQGQNFSGQNFGQNWSGNGQNWSGNGQNWSSYGQDYPSYGQNFSGYGQNFSGLGHNWSQGQNFGQNWSSYGQDYPTYGQNFYGSGYGQNFSELGQNWSGQGQNFSGYGQNFSGLGQNWSGQGRSLSGQNFGQSFGQNGIPVPPPAPPANYLWRNRAPLRMNRSYSAPQWGNSQFTQKKSDLFDPMTYGQSAPVPPPAPAVDYLWKNRAPLSFRRSGLNSGYYNANQGMTQTTPIPPPAPAVDYLWKSRAPLSFRRSGLNTTTANTETLANDKWNQAAPTLGGGVTQQTIPTSFTRV